MEVNYNELVELGFKKEMCDDEVFFNEYGYQYFIMTYEKGNISFDWIPSDRKISMYINHHLYKENIEIDEVKEVIEMLEREL